MGGAGSSGYLEIAHTADWALRVWAPTLAGLLQTAAEGMYSLLRMETGGPLRERELEIEALDAEMLLVSFLNELLYLAEIEGTAYRPAELNLEGVHLRTRLSGQKILAQHKEIKAVTYHNLAVLRGERGWQTEIVFDV